ncbi:hypothetical protein NC651_030196 [Populus alba x Populus x berolinensis]|nr:hypothetical protein NC651_030196 [Populus alba x Populus x berolinensis]
MDDEYKLRGCSRRKSQGITNLHHFRYELLNNIIDMQLTELDDRFTKTSTNEFSIVDIMVLGNQLDMYIIDLCGDDEFSGIEDIASLVEKLMKLQNSIYVLTISISLDEVIVHKRMVKGLPNIKEPEQVYVTCVLGKQAQEYFSAGIL